MSTCLPFDRLLGPVGGEVAAGPAGIAPWPFTYGLPRPAPRPPACPKCPFAPDSKLRGPVGGVAPNLDVPLEVVAEDEGAAGGGKELSNARGARGGAFPDIYSQGWHVGGEEREKGSEEMVVKSEEPAPRWRPFLAHRGDFSQRPCCLLTRNCSSFSTSVSKSEIYFAHADENVYSSPALRPRNPQSPPSAQKPP